MYHSLTNLLIYKTDEHWHYNKNLQQLATLHLDVISQDQQKQILNSLHPSNWMLL